MTSLRTELLAIADLAESEAPTAAATRARALAATLDDTAPKSKRYTCPLCGHVTAKTECCGLDLTAADTLWRMTKARIRYLRAFAHGTKGLDEDTYRLHLVRAGAQHTNELTREQFHALMRDLAKLPDARKVGKGRGA